MDSFSWIMSFGGPLICIESELAPLWGGNLRLTVEKEGAASDYERPGFEPSFLQSVPLTVGSALIIKEGVHDTSFWRRPSDKKLFVAQIICYDEDVDIEGEIRQVNDDIFFNSDETSSFEFRTAHIEIFDSVEEGQDKNKELINVIITPGEYHILSKMYDPDERSSLILHRFDQIV